MRILFHGNPTRNTEQAIRSLEKAGGKIARISGSVIDDKRSIFSLDGMMDPLILASNPNTAEVIGGIRSMEGGCPIMVIFEEGTDVSAILDAGADDVLKPPYDGAEIMSRIRSVCRRISRAPSGVVTVGDLIVGIDGRKVSISGSPVKISAIEMKILGLMATNYPDVTPKSSIYDSLYGLSANPPQEKVIDAHIHNLRKKIMSVDVLGRNFIRTVFGVGYEFAA